jgi:hypothetical protein
MSPVQRAQNGLVLRRDACNEMRLIRRWDHAAATMAGVSHSLCRLDMIKGSCVLQKIWLGSADQQ